MTPRKERFITTIKGATTLLHLLTNSGGMEVAITNYGARIVSMTLPDKNGRPVDIVLGFDSIEGYLRATETYYGAIVGRYANRIARGKFSIDDKEYQLAINNPPNHLHGGPDGFHKQVWQVLDQSDHHIQLSYLSNDGEENYPGNLRVKVTFTLTEENEFLIDYDAVTDAPTVINLTSHPFFNLNGQGSGTIENHLLMINADNYTPVDASLIPREIEPVDHTPFDFRMPTKIGERINENHEQLLFGAGYDHNYVLNGSGFRSVALAKGDRSGIQLEVFTDEPGMQFYTANHLKGENMLKGGLPDKKREAFCLETQHFPDAPNHPRFPSTLLRPGEVYRSGTVYKCCT